MKSISSKVYVLIFGAEEVERLKSKMTIVCNKGKYKSIISKINIIMNITINFIMHRLILYIRNSYFKDKHIHRVLFTKNCDLSTSEDYKII